MGVDFLFCNVAEVFVLLAQFVFKAERVGHHPAALGVSRADGHDMLAARKGDLADSDFACIQKALTNGGKGLGLRSAFGHDKVGLLNILGLELVLVNELRDSDDVLGWHAEILKLAGLDGDVLPLAVFVALTISSFSTTSACSKFLLSAALSRTFWWRMRSPVLRLI